MGVPASVALPFGAFERALADPANAQAAAAVKAAEAQLVGFATWTFPMLAYCWSLLDDLLVSCARSSAAYVCMLLTGAPASSAAGR